MLCLCLSVLSICLSVSDCLSVCLVFVCLYLSVCMVMSIFPTVFLSLRLAPPPGPGIRRGLRRAWSRFSVLGLGSGWDGVEAWRAGSRVEGEQIDFHAEEVGRKRACRGGDQGYPQSVVSFQPDFFLYPQFLDHNELAVVHSCTQVDAVE